jgi:adenine-specific DNA methylase
MNHNDVDYLEFFPHGFLYQSFFYNYSHISSIKFSGNYGSRHINVLLIYFIKVNNSEFINEMHRPFMLASRLDKDGVVVKTVLKNWDNYCRNVTNSNQEILELKQEIAELKTMVKDLMYAPGMPGYVSSKLDFEKNVSSKLDFEKNVPKLDFETHENKL